jgi:FtsP/CotA-like multicopper oxidase with cupredoxin domain
VAQSLVPRWASGSTSTHEVRLRAKAAEIPLVGGKYPNTPVWSYNGSVPGPEIRVRQGDRLRVLVENGLDEETTVHWHGVRVPNAMDGVPHLTQAPIGPGEIFAYEFEALDAGTFWYHPHQRSLEQVARGLAGPLVVDEREPIEVDRDVTWMLSDWRLGKDASLSDDFGNLHDVSHAGRIGNTVTVNGRIRDAFFARAGERVRLRLINSANARVFGLKFKDHDPQVIAVDGQPVAPHAAQGNQVVLAPGMRVDLVLDMTGRPGERYAVEDRFYSGREYWLIDLAYTDEPPLREHRRDAPISLAPNPVSEPDLANATRHEVVLGGGMMGGMMSAVVEGRPMDMRDMMRHGLAWAINGVAASGHVHEPMAALARGSSHVLDMRNETAWWHPMHLHGHVFRVLSRNRLPTLHREWQDTVLVAPRERVEVAFVADNPGDWMFHCHVLEHQAGGMMGTIRVG